MANPGRKSPVIARIKVTAPIIIVGRAVKFSPCVFEALE